MKDWFDNLDEREKTFVSGGALLVFVSLVYAFIWTPIDKGHKALVTSVATWERSLAELRPLRGTQAAAALKIVSAVAEQIIQNCDQSPCQFIIHLLGIWTSYEQPVIVYQGQDSTLSPSLEKKRLFR